MRGAFVVLLLIGWLTPGWAVDDDAAKASVLTYLEELRDEDKALGKVLEKTVVSSFLGEKRRAVVEGRLETLRADWVERGVRFEVLQVKLAEHFGAVLVAVRSEQDPLVVEVAGMGVEHKKGEWRPAPLPGGFEAVFLGFDEEVEKRVADLELWMSGERVRLREELGSEARGEFRRALRAAAPELLKEDDPGAVVRYFLEACRKRDFLSVLACLGEMPEELDRNWMETKEVLSKGLRNRDSRNQWRLMTDPVVLVTPWKMESGGGEVDVLIYDPRSEDGVMDLGFEVKRREGRWRVILPPELRYADVEESRFRGLTRMGREGEGPELVERFHRVIENSHRPLVGATLEDAGEHLLSALGSASLVDLFCMVTREEALTVSERTALYRAAAELWMLFRKDGVVQDAQLVGREESGSAAVLAVARLDVTKLNWVRVSPVYFSKEDEGWVISAGVMAPGNFAEGPGSLVEGQVLVREAFERELEEYRTKALPSLMGALGHLGDLSEPAAEKERAVELVEKFRALLAQNNPLEAMRQCALVDADKGVWNGMRAMTYAARGAKQATEADDFLLVKESGPWVAVSVRVSAPSHSMPHYPMYLIGPTEHGPRVMVDVDLRYATNKGRTMLNEESLARLGAELDAEHLALVKALFQGHIEAAERHYEEWQKNTKSSR